MFRMDTGPVFIGSERMFYADPWSSPDKEGKKRRKKGAETPFPALVRTEGRNVGPDPFFTGWNPSKEKSVSKSCARNPRLSEEGRKGALAFHAPDFRRNA